MEKLIKPEGNDDAEMADNGNEGILLTDLPDLIISQPGMIRLLSPRNGSPLIVPEVLSVLRWVTAIKDNISVWSGIFSDHAGKSYARIYIGDCLSTLCQHFPALVITADWIMFEVFGEMKPAIIDIAKYQNQGVRSLLDKMWFGPDSVIQTYLLRQHTDEAAWPSVPIFPRALASFVDCAPHDVTAMITEKSRVMGRLFWGEPEDYRYLVANLPVLLGYWSMTGAPMTWWHRQRRLAVVEQVRVFDPQWFALAYQHGVMLAAVVGRHGIAANTE